MKILSLEPTSNATLTFYKYVYICKTTLFVFNLTWIQSEFCGPTCTDTNLVSTFDVGQLSGFQSNKSVVWSSCLKEDAFKLDSQKLFFLRVMCVHGKAWRYHSHAGYAIWDIILPNGHFTKRHFAERTVCRMDFLPKRLHAEKTICRMDNLPKMELSTANELRNESSSQTIWIDDDDAGDDVRLRNFI